MNRLLSIVTLVAVAAASVVFAQAPAPPAAQKSLAATLNVYGFPTKGQSPSQQSEDEAACYQYGVQSTGTDPFALEKQAEQQRQQAQQATQQQMDNFKKAFSVCLEAKNYLVKY